MIFSHLHHREREKAEISTNKRSDEHTEKKISHKNPRACENRAGKLCAYRG